ncbi:unnamed protein product [Didymodactylos carnosus]|uniref:Prostamide/prostaglandin F synthase n=1 Tax=Didymodactylos carnosus TaxID=1234261 RepID=A0A813R3U3_9BILA|nr:unnamed protein product [Didymodactylos carnosus]CAF0777734.1 unnamed protein product [Didymodactylos carnosus]CAF3528001.1 unnamed protein product [Didymodactylos carnosus]CAF3560477.1 unnamed protein product [Didymodactylos carnosus]
MSNSHTSSPSHLNNVVGDTLITRAVDNTQVPINTIYENQPAVIIFFRRFGCQLCRSYALKLSNELMPTLKANNVAFVGIGLEKFGLEEFMKEGYFKGDLYVDEGKKAYKQLGFTDLGWFRGITTLFTKSTRDWNAETTKMGVGGNLKGDGFQLGGTYIVGRKTGEVWLSHPQKDYGDHPEVSQMLDILKEKLPSFKSV